MDQPAEPAEQPPSSDGLPDPILVDRRVLDPSAHPDLEGIDSVVLKSGPRVRKVAKHLGVRNRHTGEIHHHTLTIETYRKLQGLFSLEVKSSVALQDKPEDEIARLKSFLETVSDPALERETGRHLMIPAGDDPADTASLIALFKKLSSGNRARIVLEALTLAGNNPEVLRGLAQSTPPDSEEFKTVAAALNVARYRSAVDKLRHLIEAEAKEGAFQKLLEDNHWMFGSEYNQLLDRRIWTRDEQQDFMLQRTVDGYLEIIEIKTPLNGQPLFSYDQSHNSYFPRRELSAVVGQVIKYLEELDDDRHRIMSKDSYDVSKIRAKIFIGRDGDRQQVEALRRWNGHLYRVEVFTFDQLLRMAVRVVDTVEGVLQLPFPI